jgi:ribosomal protein S18 acetylase RimI-like enzyme
MVLLAPPMRHAAKADAPVLARLIDIAGEGIPSFLWSRSAEAGETPLEVGTRRAEREEGGFSYRNAFVAEADGRPAGMLLGYRQPDPYDLPDLAELPEVVRPLIELEALAPGSWYVNALAVLPDCRGHGLGARLLGLAEDLARQSGADTLSLIAAEDNAAAYDLYLRNGYRPVARRAIVPFPGAAHEGDWVLLTKPVTQATQG